MMKQILAVSRSGGIFGIVNIGFFSTKEPQSGRNLAALKLENRDRPPRCSESLTLMPAGETYSSLQGFAGQCPRTYISGSQPGTGSRMNLCKPAPDQHRFGAGYLKALFPLALLATLTAVGPGSVRLHAESANADFKQGQNAEAREDYDAAFEDYQKALKRNPKDDRYKMAVARVRVTASATHVTRGRKLFAAGDIQGALAEFLHAAEIDPSNESAEQEIARVRQRQGLSSASPEVAIPEAPEAAEELEEVGAPVMLRPVSNEPLTLHMIEDAKTVYQAVGKAAGINVLFDPDYNSKRIQVDLNNVSLMDALRIVGTMSNTFWRPVTSNTIFVAQNTRTKRTELDEEAVQTFYLTNAEQQNDLNDVQTALRNVMPNAKVFGVAGQNAIVMRGTPDELLLAQQLIDDLDKARGEVVVDVAVLEVSKNWEKTLGLQWPSSFGVTLQPNCASSGTCSTSSTSSTSTTSTTTSPTLYNLANLNSTNFAVSVGSATLNLLLTDDNTKILQSPRIRATDGQKADMKIGSKIPIATGSYQTGAATALVSSLVNTQFQYQDVGVEVEMTPNIHFDRDVTLKIKITVSAESGTETISGVTEPIISQRVVDQVIRLKEGEASILGGIQDNQEQQNWSGIPGLSAIPILKYIFGSKDHMIQNDDIVFVVVPHIVRTQELDQSNLRVIDTGEGQSIDLRHLDDGNAAAVTPPASALPPVRPAALEQQRPPATGTTIVSSIPGQGAIEAAPQMLAQLRQDMAANTGPAATAQASATTPTTPMTMPPATPAMNAASPPGAAPPVAAGAAPAAAASQGASFSLNVPSAPLSPGASFQVPVVLNGVADVSSVALKLRYDPTKLMFVNLSPGDLLTRDGQPAPPIHSDQPVGNLTVVASRPPGTHGVSGNGVMCVLTFQAKSAGPSDLSITQASVMNSAQQQVQVASAQAGVTVK
jgi:general secretion pathway protein D